MSNCTRGFGPGGPEGPGPGPEKTRAPGPGPGPGNFVGPGPYLRVPEVPGIGSQNEKSEYRYYMGMYLKSFLNDLQSNFILSSLINNY